MPNASILPDERPRDRENGSAQGVYCIVLCEAVRSAAGAADSPRVSVPRQWQCRGENTGSPVHQTPVCGGWDCPRSLAVAAWRDLLGCVAPF